MAQERKSQQPRRENVPGELQHASGEVEGVEASIIGGAGGQPDDVTTDAELEAAAAAAAGDLDDDGDVDDEDRALAAAANRRGSGRPPARQAGGTGGPRFVQFLRASWAELQRVQWPDRRQVGQATAVVIGFVIVTGALLGGSDWVAQRIVDFIL